MMRLRQLLLAAGVFAFMGLPLGAPSAAGATDIQGPEVLEIQITPSTVAVTGMGTQVVTISVHLTDETGVCATCRVDADAMSSWIGFATPLVELAPAPGLIRELTTVEGLTLVSGTVTDGWWATTRVVTGLWAGTHPVVRVVAEDTAAVTADHANVTDLDPRTIGLTRQLTVTASDPPHISVGYDPATVPAGSGSRFTIKGRAYLVSSGAPIANRTLWYCEDNTCVEYLYAVGTVTTDANGYYSLPNRQQMARVLFLGDPGPWSTAALFAWRGAIGPPTATAPPIDPTPQPSAPPGEIEADGSDLADSGASDTAGLAVVGMLLIAAGAAAAVGSRAWRKP